MPYSLTPVELLRHWNLFWNLFWFWLRLAARARNRAAIGLTMVATGLPRLRPLISPLKKSYCFLNLFWAQ